jgi:hypothetical protein
LSEFTGKKYASVYEADICVADTLKCYTICSYIHSTLHTCIVNNGKNVICPGMRRRLVVCCLFSMAKRPARRGTHPRGIEGEDKSCLLKLQSWLSSPWAVIFSTKITNVSF